jgi:small-conductance mechanosensitive channel
LNIPVAALAFISGAVAIGVGFGAQNIINNLISGWILMSERPVRIGDFVEIDNSRGTVESIGNRSTRIRRIDGVHLLVPNSQMLERVVVNWTLVDRNFRTSVRVGVVYGSDVRLVQRLLMQVAAEQKEVLKEPGPIVVFEDFGDNALIFDLFFWCEATGERELRLVRSDMRFRIDEYFNANGVVIAFPQRDVHLYAKTPIEWVGRDK